jgi:acetoacetyl-CoA reductase
MTPKSPTFDKKGGLWFTGQSGVHGRSGVLGPGYIATEMVQAMPQDVLEKSILPLIPIGRLGKPEEVARCVLFLVSDEAGLITGSTLTANGGQIMV